jgi:hypothetical protein
VAARESRLRDERIARLYRDGFGSDTHGNGFECHYLPYFNSNTDTNTNIVGYEYKTDSSDSDLHSDIYLI